MIAGEDLLLLFTAFFVFRLGDLGVILEDFAQTIASKNFLPKIIGLEAVRVGRVAGTVVPALIEGQEPGILAVIIVAFG